MKRKAYRQRGRHDETNNSRNDTKPRQPENSDVIIEGRIKASGSKGIHGLAVELIDSKAEYVERLGWTLTNINGHFGFLFTFAKYADLFSIRPLMFLQIRDRWGEIIYVGKEQIRWRPGRHTANLTLGSARLKNHLTIPSTWEPQKGPLIPLKHRNILAAAIGLLVPPGEPRYLLYMQTIRSLEPPLAKFNTLIEDASNLLNGDIDAQLRFRDALNFLEDVKSTPRTVTESENEDLDTMKKWYDALKKVTDRLPVQQNYIVPRGRLAPVILAAAYIDSLEPTNHVHYTSLLSDNLSALGRMDIIFNAALRALKGDVANLGYLRSILEQAVAERSLDPELILHPKSNLDPTPWPLRRGFDPDKIPLSEIRRLSCMLEATLSIFVQPKLMINYYITSISPSSGCSGDTIVITGSGFGSSPEMISFPTEGARVSVKAKTWTDVRIEVEVPAGATCGNLQLLIPAGTARSCGRFGDIMRLGSGNSYFEGSEAIIRSFTANGKVSSLTLNPAEAVTLSWNICPTTNTSINLMIRKEPSGPVLYSLPGLGAIDSFSFVLPSFTTVSKINCELTAKNSCTPVGWVNSVIQITVAKEPTLKIEGIEVTQGIQTFWRQNVARNSLKTIAHKDTIVRVYISADMGGFNNDEVPNITGTLSLNGTILNPINGITPDQPWNGNPFITARRIDRITRSDTNHTLNFRIPAYLASGTKNLFAYIIAPIAGRSPKILSESLSWAWTEENALAVRWRRIQDDRAAPLGTTTIPTDDQARFTVQRAFELLPTPATNIAPAPNIPTFSTSRDFSTDAGGTALHSDLNAEHNVVDWLGSFIPISEPNVYWIGLTVPWFRGFGAPKTCIAPLYEQATGFNMERMRAAHELGHTLGLCHLHETTCSSDDPTLEDDAFDPFWNRAIASTGHDFMSYTTANDNWITARNWNALQNTI